MAYLVRQRKTYYVDAAGKRVAPGTPGAEKVSEKSRRWYGVGIPGQPPKKRIPLATDKEASKRMLADLVRSAERGEVWVPDRDAARQPLAEHLVAFEQDLALGLATKGPRRRSPPSPAQVSLTVQRVRDVLEGCKFDLPADLNSDAPTKLARYLNSRLGQPRKCGGLSAQSCGFFLAAMKRFTHWLSGKRIAVRPDLFDSIPGFDPKNNRIHARRDVQPEELCKLIDATRASAKKFRGLRGADRAVLYLVAFSTGYRAGELAALTPECFDLESAIAALPGKSTKNKDRARQPLPPGVVHQLREFLHGKRSGKPVWPGTWSEKPAKMLRRDLAAAGVPYRVETLDGPQYADFHALRHSYLSALAAAGAGVKELQVLARHKDPSLTLGIYTHARPAAIIESVARLPLPGAVDDNPLAPLTRSELEAAVIALAALAKVVLNGLDTPRDTPTVGSEEGEEKRAGEKALVAPGATESKNRREKRAKKA